VHDIAQNVFFPLEFYIFTSSELIFMKFLEVYYIKYRAMKGRGKGEERGMEI